MGKRRTEYPRGNGYQASKQMADSFLRLMILPLGLGWPVVWAIRWALIFIARVLKGSGLFAWMG